jgi:FkbM family methyltransferase
MLRGERASGFPRRYQLAPLSGRAPWATTRKPTLLESGLSLAFRLLPLKHGAHRLLDRLRPATWVNGPSVVDVPYRGHTLRIDVSDLVGWHFLVMRNFDPEITEVLQRFACRNGADVFWDIGANKGALSYEMAVCLPSCKIVAIEPQRCMTGLLADNLETLARGRYEVFTVAIGATPGSCELVIPPDNRGRASLTGLKGAGCFVEQVEVVTADVVRRQSRYGWPTVVKIDVEGFEPEVIRSLKPAFASRRIRCCVFECYASQACSFQQIRTATQKLGYGVYAITKTPFSTRLTPATHLVRAATDYALIRDDLYGALYGARSLAHRRSHEMNRGRRHPRGGGFRSSQMLPRLAGCTGRRVRRWPVGPRWT